MQLYYCDVCGHRLMNTNVAAIPVDSHGKFLCVDCDRLTSNQVASTHRSSRRNRAHEDKRLWVMFAAAPVLFVTMGMLLRHNDTSAKPPSAPTANSAPTRTPGPVASAIPIPITRTPPLPGAPSFIQVIAERSAANDSAAGGVPVVHDKPAPPALPASDPAPAAPAPPKSLAEHSTAPAASAGTPEKSGNPAEASKAVDLQLTLDEARAKAWARLLEGETQAAVRVMEALRDNAAMAPRLAEIDEEIALIHTFESFIKAIPAGAAKIDPQHPYLLRKTDGKTIALGPDAHRSIVSVKDDDIEFEEKMGGASASQKVALCQLCAQTRYDLAVLGMPADAAGSLCLAYAAFVFVRTDSAAIPLTEVKSRIDAARKDKTLAERAGRLLERVIQAHAEQSMHAAMRRIEAAVKVNHAQARTLLSDFKRDFVSAGMPAAQEFAERCAFELAEVKQGLWASFYCGDEANPMRKYIFSREETKLEFNWGLGSPDPKVPTDMFGIRFHGLLRVTTPGTYTFKLVADDFLEMSIDGQRVVTAMWATNGEEGKTCAVKLTTGDHDLKLTFKELFVNALFSVKWKLDNESKWQAIPESALWYDPKLVDKYQKDVN